MNKYEDIINLSRPISRHPNLNINSRAAQFAPFSALTGYSDEIKEILRPTKEKLEIDEELKKTLNRKLNYLEKNITQRNEITITYFSKDKRKTGGRYIEIKGIIKKIDTINKIIKLEDNKKIPIDDLLDITATIFDSQY